MTSIIIRSIDPTKFKAVSQSIAEGMGCEPYEIAGVHESQRLYEGYNRGFAQARSARSADCGATRGVFGVESLFVNFPNPFFSRTEAK